jgi:hypothetical protein
MIKRLSAFVALAFASVAARAAETAYVPTTAFHILPETTSEESGYFSLSESLDGAIHVGTAKYNANAYLVEFDPRTNRQRIVLDTHQTCGLNATGYAAQAKLHTRNFVGRSGRVYVGSKQGYAAKGDAQRYPGGYVMVYDPRTGRTENLGMPLPGQGVIDVVADEERRRLYVVTCEEQHWMLGLPKPGLAEIGDSNATYDWKELGPLLTPYATTLVDSRGVANAITSDFQLTQCDPSMDRITTRPILVNGQRWSRSGGEAIPTWQLDPDGRHAWLILMNDPTLLRIDLHSAGESVSAEDRGRLIDGKNPDSRGALTIHPDGKIYALVRINHPMGKGMLHHLVRHDPAQKRNEDLGILKVQNPDYFDWSSQPDGKPKAWTHGFHRLPDGTLTPLHVHMALLATRDGTLYATILYPFTLLKIDAYQMPKPRVTAGQTYLETLIRKLEEAEKQIPGITKTAEQLAERHLRGGIIGFPWIGSTLEQELIGRSGGVMHVGFDRPWKKERTAEEKANDMIIFAWDDAPKPGDLKRLQEEKAKGLYVIGFGARGSPLLAEHVALCDVWIDSGGGEDDRVVPTDDGSRMGKTNHFTNGIQGWLLMGEFVGVLTRKGKMPTMWKSWAYADGREWSDRYFGKIQFHEDYAVAPIPAGEIAKQYLQRIRYMLERLVRTELPQIQTMAERIDTELRAGRKTTVASAGHMVMNYVGRFDDRLWAINQEVHGSVEAQMKGYAETPDEALVLRLGEWGLERGLHEAFQKKRQRVLLVAGENPRAESRIPSGYAPRVDYGAAFGDACVRLPGYPIGILPPSGVMQIATYETINVEVLQRRR